MANITKEKFKDFMVYKCNNGNSFIHINLKDDVSFYEKIFEYFFDENRFLNYIENKTSLEFKPTTKNYITLYKQLSLFIDDENAQKLPKEVGDEVLKILQDEYTLEEHADGQLYVRLDKMGKFGEYIFSNILSEYFGYSCIIPKVSLITDRNMNVYGIDTIFFYPDDNLILFGESKVSKTLDNGIALIKKSLATYEKQIDEEFLLVFSNRLYSDKFGIFGDKYNDIIDKSLSMSQFISKAGITNIGIPIFIAHGDSIDPNEILTTLNSLKPITIHGIVAKYITISLPIINKSKMISVFTNKIKERRDYYESIV